MCGPVVCIGVGSTEGRRYSVRVGRPVGLENRQQTALLLIADEDIHRGIRLKLRGARLYIAARRDHDGSRIHAPGLMNHLPRLPVGDVRDGAGIDDIDVGWGALPGHDPDAGAAELLEHRIRFIGIDLAAQIMQGRC